MLKTPMTDAEIIKTLGMSVQHALKNMQDFAKKLEAENIELQSLFDLQHKRTLEADKLYQKAHNLSENAFPDLGKLIEWLLGMAGSCHSCENGPKMANTPKICSGCSFAMSNPKDGVNRWEPKISAANEKG